MKKIQLYLMYLFPFLNIINYRLGGGAVLIITALYILVLLLDKGNKSHYKGNVELKHFIFKGLFFLLFEILASLFLNIGNIDFIRFFFLFLLINPFMFYKGDPMLFFKEHLPFYLKYVIVLMTTFIVVDFILIEIGLTHMQLMYNPELYTYIGRPLGLFGQPSVNSCLLCFFYLFYTAIANSLSSQSIDFKLLLMVIAGVVFQGSGSGFLSLVILIFALFTKSKSHNSNVFRLLFVGGLFGGGVYKIVTSGTVEKISSDYILFLYEFILYDIIDPYKKIAKSTSLVLWGIPECPIDIDFGPLFILGTVGLAALIYILIFWLRLFFKAKNHYLKMGLVVLLVGNMHYPVMFYMLMHFMWFYIMYYIFVVEENTKVIVTNAKNRFH